MFEIKPELDRDRGPVLFEFMGAADVLDPLMSIGSYLTHITQLVKLGELDSLLQALGRASSAASSSRGPDRPRALR